MILSKFALGPLLLVAGFPAEAAVCENLALVPLPHTAVTTARTVAADPAKNLPTFCRVAGISRPTADSEIRFEVWLPESGWNGNFEANGNGGWSGSISQTALGAGLRRGYAAAMSDLGHEGGSAEFALGHPEKLIDFGYRAAHETTIAAKAIIQSYYGKPARLSIWTGCSAGGRAALMEAQRYPEDFDGIAAGAPGLNWTGRALLSVWVAQASHRSEEAYIPPSKYPLIHGAALEKCDAADGAKDGVIEDPARCPFDPKELECKGADGPACLTAAQVETARAIYGPVRNPRTGEASVPGFARGSEMGWATMGGPQIFGLGADLFRYVVFRNPAWDYKTFNFDSDVAQTLEAAAETLNAMNPDLKPFLGRGGKLIQYHGWGDPQISPFTSVEYYRNVLDRLGGEEKVRPGYRLFMVPGMAHCGGGDGVSSFDILAPLEKWIDKGGAPEQIPASRARNGSVDRTRPLCPYPQVAVYTGKGSLDNGANFKCRVK